MREIIHRLAIIAIMGIGASAPGAASAFAGFHLRLGAGIWSQSPGGSLRSTNSGTNTSIKLRRDLGLTRKNHGYYWLDVQTPLPVVPDIRLEYSRIDTAGSNKLTRTITYAGKTYTTGTRINSHFQLRQMDTIFYYQPWSSVVHIQLGLDLKVLQLKTGIDSQSKITQLNRNLDLPLFYVGLGIDLPLTGLGLFINGSYIGVGSNYLADYQAHMVYQFSNGLGIEAGYRELVLNIDRQSINPNANIHFQGGFAGIFYAF